MLDKTLSTELNELLDRVHRASDRIGRSDAGVSAYTAQNWMKDFRRHYRVGKFNPVPAEESFGESLAAWFGSSAPDLAQAIRDLLGAPLEVLRAENEPALLDGLSSSSGGVGAFYTAEDVFFVVFETHVLAFLMGNFD